ncbi:MAG TPA: hypothetical protein VGR92_04285 [Steroidobacteraceae bacterium]|nr:hypothetical protein [Steroidobacteraceae bacterium]
MLGQEREQAVVRIRRLEVDLAVDGAFDEERFALQLARSIVARVRVAEAASAAHSAEANYVRFPSLSAHLAALLEAVAEGRANDCWWLREAAEGLRPLSTAAALRTAVLADPVEGQAALVSLTPRRLARLVHGLTLAEADRILDGLVALVTDASADKGEHVQMIERAAIELSSVGGLTALSLYVRATALQSALAGPALASVARDYLQPAAAAQDSSFAIARMGAAPAPEANSTHPMGAEPAARAGGASNTLVRSSSALTFTRFGGLLLLVPALPFMEVTAAVNTWPEAAPDTAALVAHAVLGVCASRTRLRDFLLEPLWRELFGLDARATMGGLVDRLRAITCDEWATLAPLGQRFTRSRDARFLLPRHALFAGHDRMAARLACRTLASLALGTYMRLARRLNGLRDPSAPFLFENLLNAGAVLEPVAGGWAARLSRPPLDVLLSLSRLAECEVLLPGGTVQLKRVAA